MKDMTREFRNRAKLHFKPAPDYYHMSLHNEGLFEITNAVIDELIKCSGVVKYHFPPTENNQDRLRSFKKVVLLRNPRRRRTCLDARVTKHGHINCEALSLPSPFQKKRG